MVFYLRTFFAAFLTLKCVSFWYLKEVNKLPKTEADTKCADSKFVFLVLCPPSFSHFSNSLHQIPCIAHILLLLYMRGPFVYSIAVLVVLFCCESGKKREVEEEEEEAPLFPSSVLIAGHQSTSLLLHTGLPCSEKRKKNIFFYF